MLPSMSEKTEESQYGEGSKNGEGSTTQLVMLLPLWDPILPLEINLNRLKYEGLFDVLGRCRGPQTTMDEDNDKTEVLSAMDRTSAELNQMKKHRDEYLDRIATLEEEYPQYAFPSPSISGLTWIQRYLQIFFSRGSRNASWLYLRLEAAVRCQRTTVDKFWISGFSSDQAGVSLPWTSSRLLMTLVLVLAASPADMYETLKKYTRSLGGGPITLAKARNTPSQSLRAAMTQAEAKACGPQHLKATKITAETKNYTPPKITILGVSFIDLSYLKNSASIPGFKESHTSFSRYFIIGAGPEGFIVWQTGGDGSYSLNEYINRGSDRMRAWSEAPKFLADFERFAVEKVSSMSFQVERSDNDRREAGLQRSTSGSVAALKLTSGSLGRKSRCQQNMRLECRYTSSRTYRRHIFISSLGCKFWRQEFPMGMRCWTLSEPVLKIAY